jgi:serine/threonine protein kinase
MSTKIGHFEILSELAKSATGTVYKANDPQSGQTIALKAIQLSAFGTAAADVEKSLLEEAESTKTLSSPNIAPVYGAGEIEGQFCAAMEYVQGNSIATMLARKEGFSIWDLLDIGRQVCGGLEHAQSCSVVHYSLEPAKVMCGWDGTVKILGFGVSSVGKFVQHIPGPVPSFLYYMSPEQVRGEALDARSNLFTLGAMLYEMVTDRKAFDGGDIESLQKSILESAPVTPVRVNGKIHPLLSDLIMKALEKDAPRRYERSRDLLDDLEKCKESKPQAAKPTEAPKTAAAPDQQKGVAPKPASASPAQPRVGRSTIATGASPTESGASSKPVEQKFAVPPVGGAESQSRPAQSVAPSLLQKKSEGAPKAAAAAAGAGSRLPTHSATPESAPGRFVTSSAKPTIDATGPHAGNMSSASTAEPEIETFAADAPRITVDPLMSESGPNRAAGASFSEISELPPLKEIYVAPDPPPQSPVQGVTPSVTMFQGSVEKEEKPKIQPREVAEKALKEIKSLPPRLMLYAVTGAAVLILIIGGALALRIHNQNSDDDPGAAAAKVAAESAAQAPASQPTQENPPVPAPTVISPPPSAEPAQAEESPAQSSGSATAKAAAARTRTARKKAVSARLAVVPGQVVVDSTPQGAQVQVDGKSDASWVTPVTVPGLQPGQHSITASKAGYASDTRSVEIAAGSKASFVMHLTQLMATLAVNSDPAAASVFVDGKDAGKTTPAQLSVDKGQHVILVRKLGYIDETSNAQFVPGQTVNISLTLRPLGNADSIKSVGKMKKLFGGKGGEPGQATLSIRTQPKGAQVAINQHMLDKGSPIDVMLDPGNYVVDISLSGYAPIHKIITADKSGKVVVDEILQRQ